jgi:hypothetical protein
MALETGIAKATAERDPRMTNMPLPPLLAVIGFAVGTESKSPTLKRALVIVRINDGPFIKGA